MNLENKSLVLDLLEWIGGAPRPYAEVMAAWRTSCPRLPIWEDAVDTGLVSWEPAAGGMLVRVTDAGWRFLCAERARPQSPLPAAAGT